MSYSAKDIPNNSRIITPEILAIEAGVAALKESGEGANPLTQKIHQRLTYSRK